MTDAQSNACLPTVETIKQSGAVYRPNYDSLALYPVATWDRKANSGSFARCGVYSVPACLSDWCPAADV